MIEGQSEALIVKYEADNIADMLAAGPGCAIGVDPQIAVRLTLTMTSAGERISGSGTVSSRIVFFPWKVRAFTGASVSAVFFSFAIGPPSADLQGCTMRTVYVLYVHCT